MQIKFNNLNLGKNTKGQKRDPRTEPWAQLDFIELGIGTSTKNLEVIGIQ